MTSTGYKAAKNIAKERVICMVMMLAALLFTAPLASAKSKGLEIRSENFIVHGDVSQKNAQRLITDLEIFRSNIFKLLNKTPVPEVTPVYIFATDSKKTFTKVNGGNETIAGVYSIQLEGPTFALSGKGGFKRGDYARHTALHEYTHHLIAAHTNLHFPRWYNEGFANFLATYDHSKKSFIIGRPSKSYGYTLSPKQGGWLPMKVVLSSVRNYPFKSGDTSKRARRTQHLFYAQSWLAVHYLQNTKSMAGKSTDYLNRLNRGEAALAAFEAAYGMTAEDFDKVLKNYFKRDRYATIRFKVTEAEANPKLTMRALSKPELELAKADTWRYFHKPDQAGDVEAMLTELTAVPETALEAYISSSKEAMAHQKYKKAVEFSKAAMDMTPTSARAQQAYAVASVEAYLKFGGGDGVNIKTARDALQRALKASPNDPMAHYYYALSYKNSSSIPQDVLQSALYASKRYRSVRFVWHRMQMARILMKGKQYGEARKIARFAKIWGGRRSLRKSAERMVDFIDTAEAKHSQ